MYPDDSHIHTVSAVSKKISRKCPTKCVPVTTRFTHNTGCRRVGGGTAAANAKAATAAAIHAAAVESGQKMLAQVAQTHVNEVVAAGALKK